MPQLTIKNLESQLQGLVKSPLGSPTEGYIRVETGRYKPFAMATVNAARRRGHGVMRRAEGVFYISPSPSFSAHCSPVSATQSAPVAAPLAQSC